MSGESWLMPERLLSVQTVSMLAVTLALTSVLHIIYRIISLFVKRSKDMEALKAFPGPPPHWLYGNLKDEAYEASAWVLVRDYCRVSGDLAWSEVFKYGGNTVVAELTRLFRIIWEEEAVPQDFKDATIIHLYKNKGDHRVSDNYGGIFNLRRLKARTKMSFLLLLLELLFADDCALMAHTEDDLLSAVDNFSGVATLYGLTINIKKTEVLFQPRPGTPPRNPVITIGDEQLKVVDKFCYMEGLISQNTRIDDEITSRIGKASANFGRLQHKL